MKRINFVKFHQGLFVQGGGQIGDTLPSQSKTINGLTMVFEDGVLDVTGVLNGVNLRILVPSANISVMTYVQEEPKPAVKAVKSA